MIFYHNQLMKTQSQLRLYLVANPVPFERYEDHEAALQIQLHELIERAMAEKENPIALIEDYLGLTYNGGDTLDEIANFLINTDQMNVALQSLQENWHHLDKRMPGDSLMYGSGISREDAVRSYSELTLRNYLETLSSIYNG
jgi:hypothetical protein